MYADLLLVLINERSGFWKEVYNSLYAVCDDKQTCEVSELSRNNWESATTCYHPFVLDSSSDLPKCIIISIFIDPVGNYALNMSS